MSVHAQDEPIPSPVTWPIRGKLTEEELEMAIRANRAPWCAGSCNQDRSPCDCRVEALIEAYEDQTQDAGWAPWVYVGAAAVCMALAIWLALG